MTRRNNTKLALVKSAKEPMGMYYSWCDGLWGALRELNEKYKFHVRVYGMSDQDAFFERDGIEFHLGNNIRRLNYRLNIIEPKVLLAWGTSFYDWHKLDNQNVRVRILLYAGGEAHNDKARKFFDEIVVENESDSKHFDNCPVAFGTNTDSFYPQDLDKEYPSLYPAAFAKWKRQDLWAKAMPSGSLAIGEKQEHEKECYEVCEEHNQHILDRRPMNEMVGYYNRAQGVCLTPERMGGCQRAALEAMACNVPVLAVNDSKAAEFDGVWTCPPDVDNVREAYIMMILNFYNGKYDLRKDYIVGKLDHIEYGKKLNKIVRNLL